jgi:uncharacterized protein (TIGR02145 family)
MKTLLMFSGLLTVIVLTSCKKDEVSNTPVKLIDVTVTPATNITYRSATLNGIVNAYNKVTLLNFESGLSSTNCIYSVGAIPSWAQGDSLTYVTLDIYRLMPVTTYQFRLRAENSLDTVYSDYLSFTTLEISPIVFNSDLVYGKVTDIDGNTYKTIQIAAQTWMAENLKTTKYNEGTVIPNVKGDIRWGGLTSGAYCDYYNFPLYSATYGRLYNWYVADSANPKNVCPVGWHVPTDAEWTELIDYLGSDSVAGGKLKESGLSHWYFNSGATNKSGFTALPGGGRFQANPSGEEGSYGYWWSSKDYDALYGALIGMSWRDSYANISSSSKYAGLSIRCIQND